MNFDKHKLGSYLDIYQDADNDAAREPWPKPKLSRRRPTRLITNKLPLIKQVKLKTTIDIVRPK